MASYQAMFRSNEVTVDDPEAVAALFEKYDVDGQYELDEHLLTMHSTERTFNVWEGQGSGTEDRTRAFLERLADHLEESLLVRSIGHTRARHVPDAWQWVVSPNGDVDRQTLPEIHDV